MSSPSIVGSGHKTDLGGDHSFDLIDTVDHGLDGHIDAAGNNPAEGVDIDHYDTDQTTVAVQAGNPAGSRWVGSLDDSRPIDSLAGDRFDDSHVGGHLTGNPVDAHFVDNPAGARLVDIPAGTHLDVHSACVPVDDRLVDIREDARLVGIPVGSREAARIDCCSGAVEEDCNLVQYYCFLHVARVQVLDSHQLACQR